MSIERYALSFAVVTFALLGLAGCGGSSPAPGGGSGEPSTNAAGDMASSAPEAAAPQNVSDLFPTADAKPLVLENCATCHAVACAAIGQRTVARWQALRNAHRDYLPNLAEENLTAIFTYLQSNFSDAQPEPRVPPEFLDQGCTPF